MDNSSKAALSPSTQNDKMKRAFLALLLTATALLISSNANAHTLPGEDAKRCVDTEYDDGSSVWIRNMCNYDITVYYCFTGAKHINWAKENTRCGKHRKYYARFTRINANDKSWPYAHYTNIEFAACKGRDHSRKHFNAKSNGDYYCYSDHSGE